MLAIPLFGGEHTCVDEKNFDELAKYPWRLSNGYPKSRSNGEDISIHRFITKAEKGEVVDHINGNRLLNTENNLRICTQSQNNCNKTRTSRNTSGNKGISWDDRSNKWHVRVGVAGKSKYIGGYDKLDDAIEASKAARLKYHGEYACFEREEEDMTAFYMAKWHPKSIELFAKIQEPKSIGILNLMDLTVAIPTTKNQVAIIDLIDQALVSQYKWCAAYFINTNSYYAITKITNSNGKNSTVRMHRLITDAQKGDIVDHKNGITMDNRNSNLRITDHSNNSKNRKMQSNNTSGHTGVNFYKDREKWTATYKKDRKQICIGFYNTKEEAIAARLAVVTVEYGEFLRAG